MKNTFSNPIAPERCIHCLALGFTLCALAFPLESLGQERGTALPPTAPPLSTSGATSSLVLSNAALLTLMTNASKWAERIGLDVQVDNLTLDLNGFALVGFHNSLSNLTAQQQFQEMSPSDAAASGSPHPVGGLAAADSAEIVSTAAWSNACLVLDGLSLALATNTNMSAERTALRVKIGRLLLRLNGFALLGLTNSLDKLTAQQELTPPAPAESASPPRWLAPPPAAQRDEPEKR